MSDLIRMKIVVPVIVFVVGSLLTIWLADVPGFLQQCYANIQAVPGIAATVETVKAQYTEQMNKAQESLNGIDGRLKRMEVLPVFGIAIASGCCQGDKEAFASVNEISDAGRFFEGDHLLVTTKDSKSVVKIRGSFRAENSYYLIKLNRIAVERLGDESREVRVKIEGHQK